MPCTSASVIFRTSSHSDFTPCFSDLSIKILSLGSRYLLSVALQSSHCHLVSTSLPAVGTALSSRILAFRPWLFFFVLHVRLIRVLLLTSWLTHALSPFLPSPAATGLLFLAPSTSCRLLLLCRFLVSGSLASSRLTATFWSSSSSSRHSRAASCATSRLVCSSSFILW